MSEKSIQSRILNSEIVIQEPTQINKSRYEEASKQFIESLKSHPSVISVYGTGSVSAPGISDVDFFLVLEDRIRQKETLFNRIREVMQRYNYCFIHGPIVMPKEVFTSLPLVSDNMFLRHKSGEKINHMYDGSPVTQQLTFFDLIIRKWYSGIINMILPLPGTVNSGHETLQRIYKMTNAICPSLVASALPSDQILIDLRYYLCRLHGLTYDMELYENIFNTVPTIDTSVLKKIENLRSECFNIEIDEGEILSIIIDAFKFEHQLLTKFVENQKIYGCNTNSPYYMRDPYPTVCSTSWGRHTSMQNLSKAIDSREPSRYLPVEIAAHQVAHGNEDLISCLSANKRDIGITVSSDAKSRIGERRSLLSTLREFEAENKIRSSDPVMMPHISRALSKKSFNTTLRDFKNRLIVKRMHGH